MFLARFLLISESALIKWVKDQNNAAAGSSIGLKVHLIYSKLVCKQLFRRHGNIYQLNPLCMITHQNKQYLGGVQKTCLSFDYSRPNPLISWLIDRRNRRWVKQVLRKYGPLDIPSRHLGSDAIDPTKTDAFINLTMYESVDFCVV